MDFQFKRPKRELWREKIISELKENIDRVTFKNDIEELEFDITKEAINSYESADYRESNAWKNCFKIDVIDEFQANQACLKALMQGADSLFFEINKSKTDWKKLFNGIQFEYIQTRIFISDKPERELFIKYVHDNDIQRIELVIDPLVETFNSIENAQFLLNGFELQQIGANAWQEIGVMLSTFHELIIHDFNKCKFHFHLGIGSNYFVEISKIRAIKWLCNHPCHLYQIQPEIQFSAEIGFINKSLKDPHTNLLRQTTEAMAALSGGVSELIIRAYDDLAEKGSSDFSRRMALNISNILKDESYFDFVKDPLKGSHIIELLTEQLISKAWDLLKYLEKFESINGKDKFDFIQKNILETRKKRINNYAEKKLELIGINSFVNSKEEENSWSNLKTYLEVPYLIFENCN
jgi:methylmalonyl-CoA mutase